MVILHFPPSLTLLDEFHNEEAIHTISLFPHLFKIISPINVPHLKDLLIDYLNQPFVDSVVHEFSVGFWPFAHTHYSVYPLTVDDSGEPPKSSEQLEFLNKQIQMEVNTDCYSAPFGPDLLPGVINRIVGELSDGQSVEGNSTEG